MPWEDDYSPLPPTPTGGSWEDDDNDSWWSTLGDWSNEFATSLTPLASTVFDISTLGARHYGDVYSAVDNLIQDPFGINSSGQQEQIDELRSHQMVQSGQWEDEQPVTHTGPPIDLTHATQQVEGLSQLPPVDFSTGIQPPADNLEVMQGEWEDEQAAKLADPDLFDMPTSIPAEQLNQDMITGESGTERMMDTVSALSQGSMGYLMAEPGADPWAAANQAIRANISGKEFAEFLAGEVTPEFSEDPTGATSAFTTGLTASFIIDPLNIVAGSIGRIAGLGMEVTGNIIRPIGKSIVGAEIPYLSKGLKGVSQMFSKMAYRGSGERAIMNMMDTEAAKRGWSTIEIFEDSAKYTEMVETMAAKTGTKVEYIKKLLADTIETRVEPLPIPEDIVIDVAPDKMVWSDLFDATNQNTGMKDYDDFLHNSAANESAYFDHGLDIETKMMSTDDALKTMYKLNPALTENPKQTASIIKGYEEGKKFDLPFIDMKYDLQDGQHRLLAAKQLGIDEVPVVLQRNVDYYDDGLPRDAYMRQGNHNYQPTPVKGLRYQKPNASNLSDASPIPLTNIPISRYQGQTSDIPQTGRAGVWFSVGDKLDDAKLGETYGENVYRYKVSPRNPLVLDSSEDFPAYVTVGDSVINRILGPEAFNKLDGDTVELMKMTERLTTPKRYSDVLQYAQKQADNWEQYAPHLGGADTIDEQKEIQNYLYHSVLKDEIAVRLAKDQGFDSVLTINNGKAYEYVMLKSFPEQVLDGTIPKEILDKQFHAADTLKGYQERLHWAGMNVSDELAELAMDMKGRRAQRFIEMQKAGIATPELEDVFLDYLLHYRTKEANQTMAEIYPEFAVTREGRLINPVHASQKMRQLRGLKIGEINELGRADSIPGFEGIHFEKFLEDDPIALDAFRGIRDLNTLADLNVLRKSAGLLSMHVDDAPKNWVQLAIVRSDDPSMAKIAEEFKDLRFPVEEGKILNKMIAFNLHPDAESQFFKHYDNVRNVWAALTLNMSPSTMTRNAVGNVLNNTWAGLTNPKWYEFAGGIQGRALKKVTGIGEDGLPKEIYERASPLKTIMHGGKEYKVENLVNEMKDIGVMGGGFATVETHGGLLSKFGDTYDIVDAPLIGKAAQFGRHANRMVEDNARIAHYLWARIDQGMSPLEANNSVKKYLFDYLSGLTDWERVWARRGAPFYAWTRFNLPLQVQSVLTNPKPFVRLSELVNFSRDNELAIKRDSIYHKMTPQWVGNAVGIPWREHGDGLGEFFLLGGWVPAADLELLMQPREAGGEKLMNMINPLVKEFSEQYSNYDQFYDRKIEEFEGEQQTFLGVNMRRRNVHLLRNLRVLSDFDRLLQSYYENPAGYTNKDRGQISRAMQVMFGLSTQTVNYKSRGASRVIEYRELEKKYRSAAGRGDTTNAEILLEQLQNYWE